MKFTKDSFKRITPPEIVLCKASGERVGILKTTEFTYDVAFNDLDTVVFTTYLNLDNELNPYYDSIQEMMYIEFPNEQERFVITNIDTISEGTTTEKKQVTAKSYEWMLSTRYLETFKINMGTTESLDNIDFRTLLHLCIDELFPEWTIGAIHGELPTMQRSFEISKSSVYDFLMNDVANAFECVFEFNTYGKIINAYPKSMYGENTGIMVSYENLLKTTNMTMDIADIKTSLVITGADDVNIREVARGSDRIYNFEFYNSTEYMSESLYNAYNAWQTLTYHTPVNWSMLQTYKDSKGVLFFTFDNTRDLDGNYVMNINQMQTDYRAFLNANHYEDNYNNFYTFLLNKYQKYFTDLSAWTSTRIPAGFNKRYFGYGYYPTGYPGSFDPTSESFFEVPKYTTVQRVSSLPTSRDANCLYLLDNGSYGMYRWYNSAWLNTNHWNNIALNPLKEKLKSAENSQAVNMKRGYGSETLPDTSARTTPAERQAQQKNYITNYLPLYYSIQQINLAIVSTQTNVNNYTAYQNRYQRALTGISELLSMPNNFTVTQLKELSTFIREEELNSSNYVVTDIMTDEERFDMLNDLYKFGTEELYRISQPQITFTADIINLFNMSEFDRYAGYLSPGNYLMLSLRDDYYVKPCITNIHYNFYDESDFSITFSNILKKGKNYYSDIQDVLNEAKSVASSVSFNASYWSQQSKNADTITQHLAAGLLAAGDVLKNGTKSEFLVDDRGLFVTTIEGENPKTSDTDTKYDAVFVGGGRILFTDDGWKNVRTSLGRGIVAYPDKQLQTLTDPTYGQYSRIHFTSNSQFGLFADFVLAGYVGSSTIVGGKIYSANYSTSKATAEITRITKLNNGSMIDLDNGMFEFNYGGKKRLVLDSNGLRTYGTIYAEAGKIGCSTTNPTGTGWTIGYDAPRGYIYSGEKSTISINKDGLYLGTDGIAIGKSHNYGTTQNPLNYSLFTVLPGGEMYAQSAYITGTVNATFGSFGNGTSKMNIGTDTNKTNSYIYSVKSGLHVNSQGTYLGTDGIGLGGLTNYKDVTGSQADDFHSLFEVHKDGTLYASGAKIRGTIYATSGYFLNISGKDWNIDNKGNLHANKIYYGDDNDEFDTGYIDHWIGNCEDNIFGAKSNKGIMNALKEIGMNLKNISSKWGTTSKPYFNSIPVRWDFETGEVIEWFNCNAD